MILKGEENWEDDWAKLPSISSKQSNQISASLASFRLHIAASFM